MQTAHAQQTNSVSEIQIPLPAPTLSSATTTPAKPSVEDVKQRIIHYASLWGVSASVLDATVRCESGYNVTAKGDHGLARGLAQIRSDYHPTITDSMAFDMDFSLNFLAESLSKGHGSWWTCFRRLQ